MDLSELEPGAVLSLPHDERPIRVLVFQGDIVMYDAWWPHLGSWGLANVDSVRRQRVIYYVTTVSTLLARATYLRLEPLSAAERVLHRPDLPFACAQSGTLTWSSDVAEQITADEPALNAAQVYLIPFGPAGGAKAGIRISADNALSFAPGELLLKAQAVQAPHLKREAPTTGVGIYRSGLQRGLPSFYLWGSESHLHERLAAQKKH